MKIDLQSSDAANESFLDELESKVDDNVDPEQLYRELVPLFETLPEDSPFRPRALRLLGVINNRRDEAASALANFSEGRTLALELGDYREVGTIARETSVVYAWRGDDREAARELLLALACATVTDDRQALARALAEAIRSNMEGYRYNQAGILSHALEAAALADLPPRQQRRIQVNLCQVLNRLGQHENALARVQALKDEIPSPDTRLRFLTLLEEARALAWLGQSDKANASLAASEQMASARDDKFRNYEFQEAKGELYLLTGDHAAAVQTLDDVAQEFIDRELTGRAANVQLKLAKALFKSEKDVEAKKVLASALRNAVTADLTELADRIRSEMIMSQDATLIEDLTKDVETIGGGSGLHRRFILLERIGKGGFSEVHRAIDVRDGREVALKKINLTGASGIDRRKELLASVKNEYGAAVNLSDPNIAKVRELLIKPEGTIFVIQDYVAGQSLRRFYVDGTPKSQLLALLADICSALASLHANKIVHRDLKPENIVIRTDMSPVLIDLGIALIGGQPDALAGYGAAAYIAPEQARGETVDRRADIYSLGRMVLEVWEIKGSTNFGSIPPLRWLAIPRQIRSLLRQMLQTDPRNRPSDLKLIGSTLRLQSRRMNPSR